MACGVGDVAQDVESAQRNQIVGSWLYRLELFHKLEEKLWGLGAACLG